MMNYEVFKGIVAKRIKEFLPPEYKDYVIELRVVQKVNQTMDCMNVLRPGTILKFTPNVYLNDMYKEFEKCQDIDTVLRETARELHRTFQCFGAAELLETDFLKLKDRIVVNLINTKANAKLLQGMPHRQFLDLSVTYRFIMAQEKMNLATVRVDNRMQGLLAMTEEALFDLATANMKRMFPTVIQTFGANGSMRRVEITEVKNISDALTFITNTVGVHGSSVLLFEDQLASLAEKMGSSFYIVPSSMHEVLLVAEALGKGENLQALLQNVNTKDCVGAEKLSDRVYFYDKKKGKVDYACQG